MDNSFNRLRMIRRLLSSMILVSNVRQQHRDVGLVDRFLCPWSACVLLIRVPSDLQHISFLSIALIVSFEPRISTSGTFSLFFSPHQSKIKASQTDQFVKFSQDSTRSRSYIQNCPFRVVRSSLAFAESFFHRFLFLFDSFVPLDEPPEPSLRALGSCREPSNLAPQSVRFEFSFKLMPCQAEVSAGHLHQKSQKNRWDRQSEPSLRSLLLRRLVVTQHQFPWYIAVGHD